MAESTHPGEATPYDLVDDLLESVSDGVVLVDRSWRYRYVNRSAERLIGASREDLLGKTIWEAFSQLRHSEVERQYRHALEDDVAVHFEYYYEPLASWFEIRARPWSEGLAIYLRTLDDRKAAEEALQARGRQQAAVASMGLQILRVEDVQSMLQEIARVVAELLDVEFAKVLELAPSSKDLLMKAGVGWREGAVGRVRVPTGVESQAGFTLQKREPVVVSDFESERRFAAPDLLKDHDVAAGMSVVIEGSARPFGILGAHTTRRRTFTEDDAHFLQAMANLVAAVIERHQMEDALRSSDERFRELTENIHEVLWVLNPRSGAVQYVNPAYEELWGRPSQSVYDDAMAWLEAIHPEDRPAVEEALPGLETGDFDVEFRIVRPDGTERWIHDRAFPVRDDEGRIVRIVGIAQDITERRRALESAVRLSEERVARSTAEAEIRTRDETLAIVSHDLKNPLHTILGAAFVLGEETLSPERRRQHVAIIERTVKRAQRLLSDLVDVSALQAGHMRLQREEFPLRQALEQVREDFSKRARRLDVHVRVAPSSCGVVEGDEDRIIQALSNLLDNALKHTPEKGSVTLGCEERGSEVELWVRDTGHGIPADDVSHIFNLHWQARHEGTVGAGIGLAVVKEIVEAHGGRIRVETGPSKGTEVRLTIPTSPSD